MPITAIRSLFRRTAPDDTSTLEIDRLTYAVGDVHGRADLLDRLIDRIGEDASLCNENTPRVVFLGDYIDRGEQSAQVLQALSRLATVSSWDLIFLRGNHEVMLTEFLSVPETAAARWFRNGGLETLLSFGVGGVTQTSVGGKEVLAARQALAEKIAPMADWLSKLVPMYQVGNVVFTHAGLNPALPLEAHDENMLYWGGNGIPESKRIDELWVVHGHYILSAARIFQQHIAVDTGAYYSGRLTAARLAPGSVQFLST